MSSVHFDAAVELWHEAGITRPWNDPRDDLRRALAGPAATVFAGTEHGALLATAMVGHDGHRGPGVLKPDPRSATYGRMGK